MLGDPLHLIVILGHGAAGAWDIKFVLAKLLFGAGFGLLVLRLLASVPLALLFAALGPYCGAFYFIDNHPVFFPFSYSPWVLLSALAMLDPSGKHRLGWGGLWLVANISCFNGGHVETGVVLIAGFNLAALAWALWDSRTSMQVAGVLVRIGVGTALFLGLTAPIWISFLVALPGAHTVHLAVKVAQLPLNCFPGLFDDLFYHLLTRAPTAVAPGGSLLLVTGSVLSAWHWRRFKKMPFYWINAAAILFWGGCIYGAVPASLLEMVPLLNQVGHTCVDFSYLVILHLTVQSAYGFKALADDEDFRRAAWCACGAALVLAAIMAEYCLANWHWPMDWRYFLVAAAGAVGAPFLCSYLRRRGARISLLGWAVITILVFLPLFRFGYYHDGNTNLLMLLGPRETLDSRSETIDQIKADHAGPFRVAGLGTILFGDYAAVYGIEDIRSCSPMTSAAYYHLVNDHPGFSHTDGWQLEVVDPVAAQPILNLLNVKYLLAPPDVAVKYGPGFRIVAQSDLRGLENLEVWPRAFFAEHVVPISSGAQLISFLQTHARVPFVSLNPAQIDQQPGLQRLTGGTNDAFAAATNFTLRANSTAFDIHATSAGVVCLTENQARDFTATANGQPQAVLTVNCAFKGIYLDHAGDYHIEFVYRPGHWRLACAVFWLAVTGTLAFAGMGVWRRKCPPAGNDPHFIHGLSLARFF